MKKLNLTPYGYDELWNGEYELELIDYFKLLKNKESFILYGEKTNGDEFTYFNGTSTIIDINLLNQNNRMFFKYTTLTNEGDDYFTTNTFDFPITTYDYQEYNKALRKQKLTKIISKIENPDK